MRPVVWLASYPKSGNTWMRLLISALADRGEKLAINEMSERGGMASARGPFDSRLLIDSGLLTHDEIDALRPRLYEDMARDVQDANDADDDAADEHGLPVRFVKTHDAYTLTARGEPLLAGARGAKAAIVIVRDPRDVAPSLANHLRTGLDAAIAFMDDPKAGFCVSERRQPIQLRQLLPRWSGHVASWLDQRDLPIHLLRYEDLKRDTAAAFAAVLRFAGVTADDDAIARAVALADFGRLQAQERESGFTEWQDRNAGGRLFFRRGETGAWRSELTPEQAARIEAAHAPVMRRLGYDAAAAQAGTPSG